MINPVAAHELLNLTVLKPRRWIPVSLFLLFATCLVMGWNWATVQRRWGEQFDLLEQHPQLFWLGAVLVTLLSVAFCTEPLAGMRRWVHRGFESDTRMFFAVVCLTSLVVVLLVHTAFLAKGVLLLGAILLARFDLQLARLRYWAVFWGLAIVAVSGLLVGAGGYWAWGHYGVAWLVRGGQ